MIQETQERLNGAKIFTKLDLQGAFNLIRIAEGEEWNPAFRTHHGSLEYLVMPFGLTITPASFQTFINDILREHLDIFCVAFMDEILIYSKYPEED